MGDNMTALPVLASLLLLLHLSARLQHGGARVFWGIQAAGLLAGLASGLKLTNGLYALAMCAALVTLPLTWQRRISWAWLYGCGVLAGVGLSGGHWYWRMGHTFGNPLFPQFNNYFGAWLAAPVGIGDTGWLPRSWQEKLLWPFIVALDPRRVSEIPLSLVVWPLLYLLGLALAALLFWRAFKGTAAAPVDPRRRLLFAFAVCAYVIWLNLFSIYRYLVVLELLAPLLLWLLLEALWPLQVRWRLAAVLFVAACGLPHTAGWGHARWAWDALQARPPTIAAPRSSVVFTVHGDMPTGWLVPFFPVDLAFVSLESGFPESKGYRDRVQAMLDQRQGPHFVLLHAHYLAPPSLARVAQVLQRSHLKMDAGGCTAFPTAVGRNKQDHFLCPVQRQP